MRYVQDRLHLYKTTTKAGHYILRGIAAAHNAIIEGYSDIWRAGTATLLGGVIIPLHSDSIAHNSALGDSSESGRHETSDTSSVNDLENDESTFRDADTDVLSDDEEPLDDGHVGLHSVPKKKLENRQKDIEKAVHAWSGPLHLDTKAAGTSTSSSSFFSGPSSSSSTIPQPATSRRRMFTLRVPKSLDKVKLFGDKKSKAGLSMSSLSHALPHSANGDHSSGPVSIEQRSASRTHASDSSEEILKAIIKKQDSAVRKTIPVQRKHSIDQIILPSHSAQSSSLVNSGSSHNLNNCGDDSSDDPTITEPENPSAVSRWGFVFGSVGDCKAFLWKSRTNTVTDVTYTNRTESLDARDCGGRLGPYVDKGLPDLRNLSLYITICEEGDIVIIVSDGVHDNLDPQSLGRTPGETDIELASYESWKDVPSVLGEKYKTRHREQLLRQLIQPVFPEAEVTCTGIVSRVVDYCQEKTTASRVFMETNPSLELPEDYARFPGKMDHTTCVCLKISNKSEGLISSSSSSSSLSSLSSS